MNLQQLQRLKERFERSKRQADVASGALQTVLRELNDKHGCPTLESARSKLATLRKQETRMLARLNARTRRFSSKWATQLKD